MIEVVTVFTPRKSHPKWMDYGPLLKAQQGSVTVHGHKHVVVSDAKYKGFNVLPVPKLSECLMHAIMEGQLAYLRQWSGNHPVVLLDVDCLVAKPLDPIFKHRDFDLGLTNREAEHVSPINNGAMYVAPGNKDAVVAFFERAYALCGSHWGGDQEAISQAAAPVPFTHGIEERNGLRIYFMSMLTFAAVPEDANRRFKHSPYVIHFKGEERKKWMVAAAHRWVR